MENENKENPPRYPVYTVQPHIVTRASPKPPHERSPKEQWENLERRLREANREV